MRLRILAGTIILIVGLGLYALAVMSFAVRLLPDIFVVQLLFYLVAGTIWIWPAAKLTYWTQDI